MKLLISHILLPDGSAGKQMCKVVVSPRGQINRAHVWMYVEMHMCWHPQKNKCSMFNCPVAEQISHRGQGVYFIL